MTLGIKPNVVLALDLLAIKQLVDESQVAEDIDQVVQCMVRELVLLLVKDKVESAPIRFASAGSLWSKSLCIPLHCSQTSWQHEPLVEFSLP